MKLDVGSCAYGVKGRTEAPQEKGSEVKLAGLQAILGQNLYREFFYFAQHRPRLAVPGADHAGFNPKATAQCSPQPNPCTSHWPGAIATWPHQAGWGWRRAGPTSAQGPRGLGLCKEPTPTSTSPVSFSLSTKLRTSVSGPASRRRWRGQSAMDSFCNSTANQDRMEVHERGQALSSVEMARGEWGVGRTGKVQLGRLHTTGSRHTALTRITSVKPFNLGCLP